MWNEILLTVITAACTIVAGGITLGIKILVNKITANIEDEKTKNLVSEIGTAVTEAVAVTNQTYVDSIKASGKFTAEAQKEALEKSLIAVKQSLSAGAITYILQNFCNGNMSLDEYLTYKIEAEVRTQKTEQ